MAAYTPVSHSPIWPPTWIGARSGAPRPSPTMPPDQACSVNSVAGLSLHGPSSPNGVIEATIRCGCAASSSAGEQPGSSATVDPRDHTTTSACRNHSCSVSDPEPGSTTTLRLEAARWLNSAPSSPSAMVAPDADQWRSGSPPGASTFTTSAPASASSFVQ